MSRFDLDGTLIAVAMADSGLRFIDAADPKQPRHIADFKDVRFAYDVALTNNTAFIAAGIDGMVKVSLRDRATMVKEGIARELGFIVSVEASGQNLWVLDRAGVSTLKKIPINF